MNRVAIADVKPGESVAIAGRIVAVAAHALAVGVAPPPRFRLRDESGTLEVELEPGAKLPPEGALVQVTGTAATDPTSPPAAASSSLVLRASRIELLGVPALRSGERAEWADASWPARHRELVARDALLRTLRGWFREQGFLEVETPMLMRAPGQEPHLVPFKTAFHGSRPPTPLWLATSPEYAMKRLLAAGCERIFQLGRSYRDGRDEDSPLHSPEFTLLEWYRAWEQLGAIGHDVESLLRATAAALRGSTVIERDGRSCDLASKARWLSVEQAFRELAGVELEPYLDGKDAAFVASLPAEVPRVGEGARAQADSAFFWLMVARVEAQLGVERPVLLCRYPARHAALAELAHDDPRVAERFEVYVLGIELGNAFQELRDPVEQERRLTLEQAERVRAGGPLLPIDEAFLRALRSGLPPASGIALGVDRLHLLLTGAKRVADVQPFPFGSPPD
jgi:lysyl-tRNA synthetase class 2